MEKEEFYGITGSLDLFTQIWLGHLTRLRDHWDCIFRFLQLNSEHRAGRTKDVRFIGNALFNVLKHVWFYFEYPHVERAKLVCWVHI